MLPDDFFETASLLESTFFPLNSHKTVLCVSINNKKQDSRMNMISMKKATHF